MADNSQLFGKSCNNEPRKYSIDMLQQMANKIGLITIRQTYNDLCSGLRNYFLKNNITTKQQFKRHIPKSPVGHTIIDETSNHQLGENVDLDILFNSHPEHFLEEVGYFQNMKNYTSQIERAQLFHSLTGNGFVYKLLYAAPEPISKTYSVILKINQDAQADNLVKEYLVGQCINEYSKFYPCFAKTYMIGVFSTPKIENYSAFTHQSIQKSLDTYIQPLDVRNIEQLIINGCRLNEYLSLFTQYIPAPYNFNEYLRSISVNSSYCASRPRIIQEASVHKLYELTTILHMVYQLLASFADKFTHYDLHLTNVLLVEVPNNQFIHVVFHYPDGRVLRYNMCYIPVVIDYGHCFVHCAQINTKEVMKTVCKNDSKRTPDGPLGPACPFMCGNMSGYQQSTEYDEATDTFKPASIANHFIDYTQSNVSHDCRLLNEIKLNFDFNSLPKNNFIVKKLVFGILNKLEKMDSRFGTHEDETWGHTISQIFMAAEKLTEIISHSKFNAMNDSFLNKKKLYATLHIWTDLSRPFEFR